MCKKHPGDSRSHGWYSQPKMLGKYHAGPPVAQGCGRDLMMISCVSSYLHRLHATLFSCMTIANARSRAYWPVNLSDYHPNGRNTYHLWHHSAVQLYKFKCQTLGRYLRRPAAVMLESTIGSYELYPDHWEGLCPIHVRVPRSWLDGAHSRGRCTSRIMSFQLPSLALLHTFVYQQPMAENIVDGVLWSICIAPPRHRRRKEIHNAALLNRGVVLFLASKTGKAQGQWLQYRHSDMCTLSHCWWRLRLRSH